MMNTSSNYTKLIKNLAKTNIRDWEFWDYSLLVCVLIGTIGNILSILVMNSKNLSKSNTALFVSKIILFVTV